MTWEPVAFNTAQTGRNSFEWGLTIDDLSRTAATLPSPAANPLADWWINKTDWVDCTSTTIPQWLDRNDTSPVDIRSKRKLRSTTETLWFIILPTYTGSVSITINYHWRLLLMLP